MLYLNGEEVSLTYGSKIIATFQANKMCRAFSAFLALHYVMDLDYRKEWEIALTIMQYVVYKDKQTPKDLIPTVDKIWQEYCNYIHGR